MNKITSLGNQNQYWAISELQKAITSYKSTRTRYANWASNDNRSHLNRAERTLIAAARTAASTIADR